SLLFFFFQAEDGIRDRTVTGVQTCALPISVVPNPPPPRGGGGGLGTTGAGVARSRDAEVADPPLEPPPLPLLPPLPALPPAAAEIGRASCRERVEVAGVVG